MEAWIAAHLPQVLVCRLAKLADGRMEGRHLFSDLYRQYQSGEAIRCIEGLTFNPTAVDDVAACVLAGLRIRLHGLYNVANPVAYTREAVARLFFRDRPCAIESLPFAAWHFAEPKALDTTLDTQKWQAACPFSFTPMVDVAAAFWRNADAKRPRERGATGP